MYSAKSVKGERLYKLALDGQDVERAEKLLNVFHLDLLAFEPPYFSLSIESSSGFYVRQLVADIGEKKRNPRCLCSWILMKEMILVVVLWLFRSPELDTVRLKWEMRCENMIGRRKKLRRKSRRHKGFLPRRKSSESIESLGGVDRWCGCVFLFG
jgi:hypothetical protein